MKKRKALIIGGGIAGPALALFLKRAGIDAAVYEAKPSPSRYAGLFLNVAPNGLDVLRTLGIDQTPDREGVSLRPHGDDQREGQAPRRSV